jgi:hypothetical protein
MTIISDTHFPVITSIRTKSFVCDKKAQNDIILFLKWFDKINLNNTSAILPIPTISDRAINILVNEGYKITYSTQHNGFVLNVYETLDIQ